MAVTGLWIAAGISIFGDDWKPESDAEQNALNKAFYDYFKAKGMADLPPGWALAATLGMYTAARLRKPTVAQRIGYGVQWIGLKIKGVFIRGTRTSNRADGMRKKHAGKEDAGKAKGFWRRNFGA
jgi:hypothetical protein